MSSLEVRGRASAGNGIPECLYSLLPMTTVGEMVAPAVSHANLESDSQWEAKKGSGWALETDFHGWNPGLIPY